MRILFGYSCWLNGHEYTYFSLQCNYLFENILLYVKILHIFVSTKRYIKMETSSTNEFLRGTLKTIILKLLAEKGRMYGYEITQEAKIRTNGEIKLTFGALYPVLHKLEQEGLLITESEEADGRLRKYYSLTVTGTATAEQKVNEFERFVEAMRALLQPEPQLALAAI